MSMASTRFFNLGDEDDEELVEYERRWYSSLKETRGGGEVTDEQAGFVRGDGVLELSPAPYEVCISLGSS